MNGTLSNLITCGKCHNKHSSVFEVKLCHGIVKVKPCAATMVHGFHQNGDFLCNGIKAPATVEQKVLPGVTQPQLDYIARLGGSVERAKRYSMKRASEYIDDLKKNGPEVTTPVPAWEPPPFKVPLTMLDAVPDGYYAVQPDANTPLTFFRISRPKTGNYKTGVKVQTQHGPEYTLRYVLYPGERLYRYGHTSKVEDDLLLLVVDPHGANITYAEKIGRCMACNTELTDERSRWYGIGPECEKKRPWVIAEQNDRKGPFVHGWSQS